MRFSHDQNSEQISTIYFKNKDHAIKLHMHTKTTSKNQYFLPVSAANRQIKENPNNPRWIFTQWSQITQTSPNFIPPKWQNQTPHFTKINSNVITSTWRFQQKTSLQVTYYCSYAPMNESSITITTIILNNSLIQHILNKIVINFSIIQINYAQNDACTWLNSVSDPLQ